MEMTPDAPIHLSYDPASPERPTRARTHSRSRSQGNHPRLRDRTNFDPDGEVNGGRPARRLSHLRATSYTPGLRARSRLSWDGQRPLPQNSSSRTPSPSPPPSPIRHATRRPRPASAISLPDYYHHDARGRPTIVTDRWSYDRERMPSPPPLRPPAAYAYSVSAASSRPGTPVSIAEHAGFSSRPASTHIDSAPPSRPHSAVFPVADHTPNTPTLRIVPPEESQNHQKEPLKSQPYHILTSEELDLLSRPPPLHPAMTASPLSRPPSLSSASQTPDDTTTGASTPTAASKLAISETTSPSWQLRGEGRETDTKEHQQPCPDNCTKPHEHHYAAPGLEPIPPGGCCGGLCEFATAKVVGGKFGAWLLGMAIPVTFRVVSGCLSAVFGCR
ncbi:hypothetical protein VTJ49DRAFT_1407 [Mycothermus thermophilus]|uniref:Uncharacterized protein n=1 Tax=Humicola insolens TaxID=85995 RepID=A0ABR3VCF8_HUMIN